MVLKDAVSKPLFRPETPVDDSIMKYFRDNGYILYELPEKGVRDPLNNVNLLSGGYFGKNEWVGCLGSAADATVARKRFVGQYIPSILVDTEEVKRWCEFITKHYDMSVTYAGEYYIPLSFYGYNKPSNYCRSHLIIHNYQKWHEVSNYTLLSKITMIRYLYRKNHLRDIITPIYHMVEELGMNPFDALYLGHFNLALRKQGHSNYGYGTSMLSRIEEWAMAYPRDTKRMVEMFSDYTLINATFGLILYDQNLFVSTHVGEYNLTTGKAYLPRDGWGTPIAKDMAIRDFIGGTWGTNDANGPVNPTREVFKDPYLFVYKRKFDSAILDGKWQEALNIYVEFMRSLVPTIKRIIERGDTNYYLVTGRRTINNCGGRACITTQIFSDILKFIQSFDNN